MFECPILQWFCDSFFEKKIEIKNPIKILFITKSKNQYGIETNISMSTGLFNSALHCVQSLNKEHNLTATCVSVQDNNCIDRIVRQEKPHIVILEALWVVPEKFHILRMLHPQICWVIRIHSNLSFLASEGIAIQWIKEYLSEKRVYVAANSEKLFKDLNLLSSEYKEKIKFLPNLYYFEKKDLPISSSIFYKKNISIGCFGAIRLMKNQLIQAVAAIVFAKKYDMNLTYYINSSRLEGYVSENILKNIRSLFKGTPYKLIEIDWFDEKTFKEFIKHLDLGLQISFSETFNMISADLVSSGVPVVGSHEISWLPNIAKTSTTNLDEILQTIESVFRFRNSVIIESYENLINYNKNNKKYWIKTLKELTE